MVYCSMRFLCSVFEFDHIQLLWVFYNHISVQNLFKLLNDMTVFLWDLTASLCELSHDFVHLVVLIVELCQLKDPELEHELFILGESLKSTTFSTFPVCWMISLEKFLNILLNIKLLFPVQLNQEFGKSIKGQVDCFVRVVEVKLSNESVKCLIFRQPKLIINLFELYTFKIF